MIVNCGFIYELFVLIMEIGNLEWKDICINVYFLFLIVIGCNDNCYFMVEINLFEVYFCINVVIFSSILY